MTVVVALLQSLAVALGVGTSSGDHAGLVLVVLGAAALAAVVVVALPVGRVVGADGARAGLRFRERFELAVLLPQSDPDAAGRPRPRAPGILRRPIA
ncbi:DUF6412 domain-containing protein [Agromyces seonyuensis]|uniref:Uncharacterized protein n=1 Tax=Agromyces seonyuensis TaxID=2662446 RepID=A0A6I4P1N5_9MICO|nr:DUF6412 domain-containing protein [Agromyces seonyuensis]MWC00302.1 hypothetical protein [Agromyces seonyuensis]